MFPHTGFRAALAGLAACAALAGSAEAHKPHQIKVLHSLCQGASCPQDGANLDGQLAIDAGGNFYGFTSGGGITSRGTVFKRYRAPGKQKWKSKTIVRFLRPERLRRRRVSGIAGPRRRCGGARLRHRQ